MSISASIKALLSVKGFKQNDLIAPLKVKGEFPTQSLSNKFRGERWSASDLVTIAEFTGCKLAFVLPDGERVLISGAAGVNDVPVGKSVDAASARVTPKNSENKKKAY